MRPEGRVRKWDVNLAKDFRASGGWQYAESPSWTATSSLPGRKDATMAALDKMTGEIIWKADPEGGTGQVSSVMISTAGGVNSTSP